MDSPLAGEVMTNQLPRPSIACNLYQITAFDEDHMLLGGCSGTLDPNDLEGVGHSVAGNEGGAIQSSRTVGHIQS